MRRWIIVGAGMSAIVVLFFLLRPAPEADPSATPTATPSPTLTTPGETPVSPSPTGADALEIEAEVEEGRVTLEVEGRRTTGRTITVQMGSRVEIEVKSDTTDEVHVHGYDLKANVTPDRRGRVRFVADVVGIFEVELEEAGLSLFRLKVSP
jgi:heme/copper-type cytochrome/quinol oxidase subunit 2